MKKKLLLRLCLIITVALSLYSCIHEEIISSSDLSSTEYTNKSLWKEDETYIKNVKQVFNKYADKTYFINTYGEVYWNYALTMGTFDESFLEVPIIKNGKINEILIVERKADRVYFSRKINQESNNFFDLLVFKDRNQIKGRIVANGNVSSKGNVCYTVEVTFTWTNEDGSAGPTYTYHETRCRTLTPGAPNLNSCLDPSGDCSTGNGGGGNGGYPYPQTPQDPCEKTKAISTDPAVKAKVGTLKEQSKIKGDNSGEKGFNVNLDGTTGEIIPGEKHSVDLGSEAGKQGGYHNHTPDGIKMHSPPDILKMLNYALAQPNGNLSHGFLGFVGSEKCSTCPDGYKYHNYIIRFSGNSQELEKFIFHTNWDEKALGNDYQKRENNLLSNNAYTDNDGESLNQKGLEKLFFDTLKGMNMEGKVNLQRVDNDGTIQNIILDNNNQPTATPCP